MRKQGLTSGIAWIYICFVGSAMALPVLAFAVDKDREALDRHFRQSVRPIVRKHCGGCHNEADKKAGLNLLNYDFTIQIIRDGERWANIIELVENEQMPPPNKPRMTTAEKDTFVHNIRSYLSEALAEPDPGQVILRRLSHREYRHTIQDLIGIDVPVEKYFPADGSGGGGFDNQSKVLYLSPLLLERYYEVAQIILDSAYQDAEIWDQIVPHSYQPVFWEKMIHFLLRIVNGGHEYLVNCAKEEARKSIISFATQAYRRFLSFEEKERLIDFFAEVYTAHIGDPDAFDLSIRETYTSILISHAFLYRREVELPLDKPYPISDLELASRLSYLLWSSMPDDTLLEIAYREELHKPEALKQQVSRMLENPKSMRFAQSFVTQWLELNELENGHQVDFAKYPEYDEILRKSMISEASYFFHYILTNSKNFLDLIDSDYTFVNESLARIYGIKGIEGPDMRKVSLEDPNRGGVLGMAGVLTTTSLPLRTSPVLRGKWVLEQVLGTPPPPPPPDVPELEAAKEADTELDLRELLMLHRSSSTCYACHQKMDPIGLGLENFDAIGRWRDAYGEVLIDASGMLVSGEPFNGPAELKQILLEKKEDFAENLSRRMLSYALGRGIRFQDYLTVKKLTNYLLENDFDTEGFMYELVMSFPFRYKKSDLPEI